MMPKQKLKKYKCFEFRFGETKYGSVTKKHIMFR